MRLTPDELARVLGANPDIVVDLPQAQPVAMPQAAKQISLTLAYGPSANRYWRNVNGRVVRSAAATAYKAAVGLICVKQGIQPLLGALRVTLDFYRPQRSGDLDNRIKCILDSLIGHAYMDDKQIVEIHAFRFEDPRNPRVEVWVSEVQ